MPKRSDISFPTIGVEESAQIATRIVKEFRGNVSIQGLARALNMSERGGGFLSKAAALREYGFIEGRGDLVATDLAQRVAYPSQQSEATSAKREAFLRVDLFRRLSEKLGSDVPDEDQFAIHVEEATRAARMEVAEKAGRLRRLYAEGAKFLDAITTVAAPQAQPLSHGSESRLPSGSGVDLSPDVIELRSGDTLLRLPRTVASVELLKAALDDIAMQLNAVTVEHQAHEEQLDDEAAP